MSDRLDIVIIEGDRARIHHQRWGATALLDLLLGGPDRAPHVAADGFEETEQLDDLLAACVIDRTRQVLIVSGPAAVIGAAGKLRPQEQDVLRELATAWPGWHLAYEPVHVVEPVLAYVQGLGIPLASLNDMHAIADHRRTARFERCAYTVDVPAETQIASGPPLGAAERARPIADLEDRLSVRASNELRNSPLTTIGELLDHGDTGLAALGISDRARRELAEVLADLAPA